MAHKHGVYDTDPHFSIDKYTRSIVDTSNVSKVIKQGDHNSERFSFDLPRYIDEHDMSLCDSVTIHFINTDGTNVSKSVYEVNDLRASSDDEVVFTWLISREATMYAGTLSFAISFECVTGGVVDYSWSAGINSDVVIGENINNGEVVVSQYVDILAQWKQELIDSGVEGVNVVDKALSDALATFNASAEAKGAAVLATIPDEYTELSNKADYTYRNSAPVIEQTTEGETIVVNDSANMLVLGLNVYGKSTQDGEPSPDNPKEIVSLRDVTVSILGKNLLDVDEHFTFTHFTSIDVDIPAGSYVFSFESSSTSGTLCPNIKFSTNNVWCELYNDNKTQEIVLTKRENKLIFYADGADYTWSTDKTATIDRLMLSCKGGAYEPYIAKQNVVLDDVLSGIPVESNGNYTDSEGQQWVCDEIDFERGVYIRRIRQKVFDGSETLHNNWYPIMVFELESKNLYAESEVSIVSNYFKHTYVGNMSGSTLAIGSIDKYGFSDVTELKSFMLEKHEEENPVVIQYALATPIETPLTDEELTAYKELHTNYPVTTVVNNSGAHMKLVYAADTKTYIDNKFAELSALISNNA